MQSRTANSQYTPSDYKNAWKMAFNKMKPWTQAITLLPTRPIIFNRALIASRAVTQDNLGLYSQSTKIASEITEYICQNFDPSRVRTPPDSSRPTRKSRNEKVLEFDIQAKNEGTPQSRLQIAKHFGISETHVRRILNTNAARVPIYKLSTEATNLARILDKILPEVGKRAIYATVLAEQCGLGRDASSIPNLQLFLHELSESTAAVSATSWHFHFFGDEVLMCRGRPFTPQQFEEWRPKARHTSICRPKRQLEDFGSQVWADLLAADIVSAQQASADDWRAFLQPFTLDISQIALVKQHVLIYGETYGTDISQLENLCCDDIESLVTRIRKGLRLFSGNGYLNSIRVRNQDYLVGSKTLSQLLYFVEHSDGFAIDEIVNFWVNLSHYRLRIRLGLLPGRRESDVDSFLEAARDHLMNDRPLQDALRSQAVTDILRT